MFDSAIETIMKGVGMLEHVLEEKNEQFSEREKETDAALDTALADRTSQQRGILERIAALEVSVAKKESECKNLAAQMSSAYGSGKKADGMKLEDQLDAIQRDKDILEKKIARMKENTQQIAISERLAETATEKLLKLIQESFEKKEELSTLELRINELIDALTEVRRKYSLNALQVNPQLKKDRAKKLIEIIESKTGPLDVTGHACGSVEAAKIRYILSGPDAPGLENTPLVRGLRANSEESVSV